MAEPLLVLCLYANFPWFKYLCSYLAAGNGWVVDVSIAVVGIARLTLWWQSYASENSVWSVKDSDIMPLNNTNCEQLLWNSHFTTLPEWKCTSEYSEKYCIMVIFCHVSPDEFSSHISPPPFYFQWQLSSWFITPYETAVGRGKNWWFKVQTTCGITWFQTSKRENPVLLSLSQMWFTTAKIH